MIDFEANLLSPIIINKQCIVAILFNLVFGWRDMKNDSKQERFEQIHVSCSKIQLVVKHLFIAVASPKYKYKIQNPAGCQTFLFFSGISRLSGKLTDLFSSRGTKARFHTFFILLFCLFVCGDLLSFSNENLACPEKI